jgi:hypothetical protein
MLLPHLIFSRISFLAKWFFCFSNLVVRGGRGVFFLFFLFFSSFPAAFAESTTPAEKVDVTIVLSEDGGAYAEFSNALRNILSAKGLTYEVIGVARPVSDSGLVIAVGMKAATSIAASNSPSVLNVLIPKSGYEKLLHDFPKRAGSPSFSCIFLDQPVQRQVRLIKAILPDSRTVGLLYSAPPAELAQLRQKLAEQGMGLREQKLDASLTLSEALQDLLKNSEVLLALPDASVYNGSTIRNILLASYRSAVPLIGFSSGYVKAGSLGAIFSTPTQIATQAAVLIRQFNDTQSLPAPQYPYEFEVQINEQVARSLGLRVNEVSVIHDQINALSRRVP